MKANIKISQFSRFLRGSEYAIEVKIWKWLKLLNSVPFIKGIRTITPWTITPRQLPPDKYSPDNYPLGQIPPGHLPPWEIFQALTLVFFVLIFFIFFVSLVQIIIFHMEGDRNSSHKTSLKSTLPKPELAILLNLSVADIRTAINGSRTSFRTTPTTTLCSIFVGLPTTSACEEHFFSCFRLYATPKRLF